MRALALLLLASSAAFADEVDLSQRRRNDQPPPLVLRAEGGTSFAPFGYAGAALSWLTESDFEFEAGAGGGFPGLQLGLAVRRVFGDGNGLFVTEAAVAGNTRVNRGASDADRYLNAGAASTRGSLWTAFGLGFEQRNELFDVSVVGSIVFTTASLTPKWALHGGVGIAF